jgi:aminoglycoside phosphotransferase (APT) family kinase protein
MGPAGAFPFPPVEPSLPGAAELLSGGGEECLARFLLARGWEPESLTPVQLLYRPERSLAVRFEAGARQLATGAPASFTLTAECRAGGPPPPPAPPGDHRSRPRLLDDPVTVSGPYLVWAFPYDPSLPGLPAAAHAPLVRRRLSPSPESVAVEPLRYRPRRRAVLRYRVGHRSPEPGVGSPPEDLVFAKVLPPARAEAALAAAQLLRDGPPGRLRLALPIGRLGKGALLVRAVEGRSLRTLLLEGERLPPPERIARLPDDLSEAAGPTPGGQGVGNTRRRVQRASAERAAEVVTRVLPSLSTAAGRLVESVGAATGDGLDERIVHGDLSEGQVLVGAGERLGLVDLDDVGPGDPILDAATFCAHLLALAASAGVAAGRILRYRESLRAAFLRRLAVDPRALAWREAYALLLLAPGPLRVLHPDWPRHVATRVELAGQLLDQGG